MTLVAKNAVIQQEKGPENLLGIVVREIKEWPGAPGGYATFFVDFWDSQKAFENNEAGFNGLRKSDILQQYTLHHDADTAKEAEACGE